MMHEENLNEGGVVGKEVENIFEFKQLKNESKPMIKKKLP
jgi:hypothetical protein